MPPATRCGPRTCCRSATRSLQQKLKDYGFARRVNLLLLAIAFRAWSGSALSVFLRVMAAIADLLARNPARDLAARRHHPLAAAHQPRCRRARRAVARVSSIGLLAELSRDSVETLPPLSPRSLMASPASRPCCCTGGHAPAAGGDRRAGTAGRVAGAMRPVMGADPYHLQRVDQITRVGNSRLRLRPRWTSKSTRSPASTNCCWRTFAFQV